ncbi:MAG: UDP-N-acetylenolpyruvoylglucosamine reductase, partial [Bacteroidota bacterium]|nr:UDP-N-acetylenolpyruvoylglucosamine reductase [Bacteroidota bacterium]
MRRNRFMQIREDISLKPYNSFGIDVRADFFVELTSEDEILTLIHGQLKNHPGFLIMGGGSNMLFVKDYQGLVIRMANKGIRVIGDN